MVQSTPRGQKTPRWRLISTAPFLYLAGSDALNPILLFSQVSIYSTLQTFARCCCCYLSHAFLFQQPILIPFRFELQFYETTIRVPLRIDTCTSMRLALLLDPRLRIFILPCCPRPSLSPSHRTSLPVPRAVSGSTISATDGA